MCGFLISITKKNNNYKWRESFLSIKHRGPDSSKIKLFKNNFFYLKFGFHRLSIVDHKNDKADQPFVSERSILLFNGEIYNYIFLRKKLLKKKIQFETNSDTEVLLRYLETFGLSKTQSDIDGMWSFVWLDKKKNKIYLSRDQYGQKPMYYYKDENIFLIASEIKALLKLIKKKNLIDSECASNFLNYGLIDYNQNTLFSNIKQIKPSHCAVINIKNKLSFKENCYYKNKEKKNIFSFETNKKKLTKLLTESVLSKLSSEVKFGVLLSGGIDSSIIFSIIKKNSSNDLNLLYTQSKDKKSKDNKRIQFLKKNYSINIKKFLLTSNNKKIFNYIKKLTYINDYPLRNISSVNQYLMGLYSKKKKIKILISGQGADEIFFGYLKYYSYFIINLIKQKKFLKVFLQIMYLIKTNFFKQFKLRNISKYLSLSNKNKYIYPNSKNTNPPKNFKNFKNLKSRSFLDTTQFSVPSLSHGEDRMYMASGVEVRFPYLNTDLQRLSLSLSDNMKVAFGYTKFILRKAFENKIPKKILFSTYKEGFQSGLGYYLHKSKNLIRKDILNEKSLIFRYNIIDIKFLDYLNGYFKSNFVKSIYDENFIFRVICFEIWMIKFKKYLFFKK